MKEIRLHLVNADDMVRCDFCGDDTIYASYDAADFVMSEIVLSEGYWFACRDCSRLIESNEWPALTERALEAFIQRNPPARAHKAKLRAVLGEAYAKFQALRKRAS